MGDSALKGEMYIEYMALGELEEWPRNPKDHDMGEIGMSMDEYGYVLPMVLDEGTGKLVAGHGRKRELERKKRVGDAVPYRVRVRDGDGEWLVPVIRGIEFEDAEQAEGYLLADNRTVELGGWHDDVLSEILAERAEWGEEGLRGTGFDLEDTSEILRRMQSAFDGDSDNGSDREGDNGDGDSKLAGAVRQAEIDAVVNMWEVNEGDVFEVGGQWLVCGDCRDRNAWRIVMSLIGAEKVDGVMTSPPYAEQRVRGYGGEGGYGGIPENEYVGWWERVQTNVRRYLADHGSFFINIKPHARGGQRSLYVMDLVIAMVRQWGWCYIDEFSWERTCAPGSWPNRFKNGFEPVHQFAPITEIAFYPDQAKGSEAGSFERHAMNLNTGSYYNTDNTYFEWDGALPSNRIPIRENASRVGFEAVYPWKLPAFFMQAFSLPGELWVDPFVGSGSTLVAAHKTSRFAIGIDNEPANIALAIERLQEETNANVTEHRGG